MKQENVRILVAAAIGATTGLLLGMYLFSEDEKKGKLSKHLESLSSLVKELEDIKTDEAREMKDKVKNVLNSVQELLDQKDGKPE
jgi:glucose-6-phosphate-specific signal transduction histidine kinase